jgi:hypothetical protein
MFRRFLSCCVIGLFAICVFSVVLASAKVDKVDIVHNGKVISVPASAVPAHLGHGDTLVDDGPDDCGDCDPV